MNLKLVSLLLLVVVLMVLGTFGIGFMTSRLIAAQRIGKTPAPTGIQENTDLRKQRVPNIGLTLSIPAGLSYREELADDYGKIRTMAFYLENADQSKIPYQLYALYQANTSATQADLVKAKSEMDPTTIKDISIAGFPGIEGVITGPKARYISIIIKDGQLFSVSTTPVTAESKKRTDDILSTFRFE